MQLSEDAQCMGGFARLPQSWDVIWLLAKIAGSLAKVCRLPSGRPGYVTCRSPSEELSRTFQLLVTSSAQPSSRHFNPPSQRAERSSGAVSQVRAQHLALPGLILVLFLNYSCWIRSLGVGHKLVMSENPHLPYLHQEFKPS